MSDTVTIDQGHTQVAQPKPPPVAIEDSAAGPSDADQIREAQAAMERATATANAATQSARNAQTEAARARDELARTNQARLGEQRAILAQTVETADAEISRARQAMQTATETNDPKSLADATEALSSARFRKDHAAAQLAGMPEGTGGQQQRQAQPQQSTQQPADGVPGPRSRQWISDHPQFDTDPRFKRVALLAHQQAVELGFTPETDDRYFQHLDSVIAGAFPGATRRTDGGQQMNNGQGNSGGNHTSTAGPSNRGGGGMQGGFKAVKTGLGMLEVAVNGQGQMRIKRPQGEVLENMTEGAKVCFPGEYSKDPERALTMYLGEQAKIGMEQAAGGSGGLVYGEGATIR